MILIEAIIRPEKLEIVKDALIELGLSRDDRYESKRTWPTQQGYRLALEENTWLLCYRGLRLKLPSKTRMWEKIVHTIINEAQTGSLGDGDDIHSYS